MCVCMCLCLRMLVVNVRVYVCMFMAVYVHVAAGCMPCRRGREAAHFSIDNCQDGRRSCSVLRPSLRAEGDGARHRLTSLVCPR